MLDILLVILIIILLVSIWPAVGVSSFFWLLFAVLLIAVVYMLVSRNRRV